MPGEAGSKVKSPPGYSIFENPVRSCGMYLENSLIELTVTTVRFQGDRGFDGLPGLPGEKGHRVSMRMREFTVR